MEKNEILRRAKAAAEAEVVESGAAYEAVSARQRALGDTLAALDKRIVREEAKFTQLPTPEQAAAKAALDTLGADPTAVADEILSKVELARVEREKASRDLSALFAAQGALKTARDRMHPEANAAHQRLVKAQAATRVVAAGARSDEAILSADPAELSSVEQGRRAELYERAAQ